MSITSLSFTFVNTYAPQSAKPAGTAAAERAAPAEQAEKRSCGEHRPASRQNRLVEAMMSALRELGFGSQAAATTAEAATGSSAAVANAQGNPAEAVSTNEANAAAAVTDTAAATAVSNADSAETAAATKAAAEPAVTVEAAVHQFAYELFRALRQVGRGESSEQGSNRIDGDGNRRHHHHGHHGWRREGYGDMAQRLDALSQTFAAPAAVAAGSDAQSNAPVSTSISITLTIQNGVAEAPAEAVTTTAAAAAAAETTEAAEASEAVEATPAAATPTAREVARNPLLDAFSKLFSALKPQAAQNDMGDKLRAFLQTLAQAMRPESMSNIQTPQVGGLVNVTA